MYMQTIGFLWLVLAQQTFPCHGVIKGSRKRISNEKRMPPEMHIRTRPLDEDTNLWLNPIDSVLASEDTPVYMAKSDPGSPAGVRFTEQHGLMEATARWLRNPRHLPFITLGRQDRVEANANGKIRSQKLGMGSTLASTVSVSREPEAEANLAGMFSRTARGETPARKETSGPIAGIPFAIYPKVLVVAEYSMYENSGRDVYGLLKHLLTMMNGIDLKYRSLEHPRVRLHIAGIIVATDPGATPFIAKNMISAEAFNTYKATPAAKNFFYDIKDSIPLESYDMALTITRLEFGAGRNKKILGQSWDHTVCVDNTRSKLMTALAVVRDNDAFESIHYAAHELGHIMGLDHDTIEPSSCNYTDGFLMSFAPIFTKKSSSFSNCSLRQFQENLQNHKLDCLFERPQIREGAKLPNLMPGKIVSLAQQCATLNFGPPCIIPDLDICTNMACYDEKERQCTETEKPALVGTRCNDDNEILQRYCVQHECVPV